MFSCCCLILFDEKLFNERATQHKVANIYIFHSSVALRWARVKTLSREHSEKFKHTKNYVTNFFPACASEKWLHTVLSHHSRLHPTLQVMWKINSSNIFVDISLRDLLTVKAMRRAPVNSKQKDFHLQPTREHYMEEIINILTYSLLPPPDIARLCL